MKVIDLLLPQVDSFLSDGGVFYLLTVEENRPGIGVVSRQIINFIFLHFFIFFVCR